MNAPAALQLFNKLLMLITFMGFRICFGLYYTFYYLLPDVALLFSRFEYLDATLMV